MSVAVEPERSTNARDEEALKEIRDLFSRYRRLARHGMVSDRFDRADDKAEREPEAEPDRG